MTSMARAIGVGMVLALAALVLTSSMGAAQGGTLQVTATYQGSGEVGPNNAIWLAAWDTPNIPPDGSVLPIGGAQVVENGGTATFAGLSASTVYLTAIYDAQGGMDGENGGALRFARRGLQSERVRRAGPHHGRRGRDRRGRVRVHRRLPHAIICGSHNFRIVTGGVRSAVRGLPASKQEA